MPDSRYPLMSTQRSSTTASRDRLSETTRRLCVHCGSERIAPAGRGIRSRLQKEEMRCETCGTVFLIVQAPVVGGGDDSQTHGSVVPGRPIP